MPTADQILNGLQEISNTWKTISIFWHLYFGVFMIVLAIGYCPSKRISGILLGLPFLSVSASAWLLPNPVNGVVFAIVGIVLLIVASKLPHNIIRIAPGWSLVPGVLLFVSGWIYPHFLDTTSYWPYLYAAPIGTIPCPTLIIVIGAALIMDGLGSRTWCAILGLSGLLYGVMGVAFLHLPFDWALIIGASMILINMFTKRQIQPKRELVSGT